MNGHTLLETPPKETLGLRNRVGLYGAYFFGMSGIGFCLPYLPLYLKEEKGFSDRGIALVWVLSAVAGLLQFPIGLWSDRAGTRKPFLVAALAILAVATLLLPLAIPGGLGWVLLGFLVVLFAENGACRATVESLAGAEATRLAAPDRVGAALGSLRFWRPVGIVLTALIGGVLAEEYGVGWLLGPVAVVQGLAVVAALLIRENGQIEKNDVEATVVTPSTRGLHLKDSALWAFIVAMILFHVANAPPGAYLGLFLKHDLGAPASHLSYAFVISMVVWMAVVRPIGWLADHIGRKPLLMIGWAAMTIRLVLLAFANDGWQVLLIQLLDGLAQGLFAVTAAAWVTDRLADPRRAGEAQVLVGSSLVLGSALGPALAGLVVEGLGYRGTFGVLVGVGIVATLVVILFVPETHPRISQRAET
jgi:predicted MFS family arabinose efflux permease